MFLRFISEIKSKLLCICGKIKIAYNQLDREQHKVNADISKALCIAAIVGGCFNPSNIFKVLAWFILAIVLYLIAIKEAKNNGDKK